MGSSKQRLQEGVGFWGFHRRIRKHSFKGGDDDGSRNRGYLHPNLPLMIVPYTRRKLRNSQYPIALRPELGIELFYGSRSVSTIGHIDTGADHTLINKEFAKQLGLDWKSGVKTKSIGIVGNPVDVYLNEIELEVARLPGSRYKIVAGFIESRNVAILLGQVGFFDNLKITFERSKNRFAIETIK